MQQPKNRCIENKNNDDVVRPRVWFPITWRERQRMCLASSIHTAHLAVLFNAKYAFRAIVAVVVSSAEPSVMTSIIIVKAGVGIFCRYGICSNSTARRHLEQDDGERQMLIGKKSGTTEATTMQEVCMICSVLLLWTTTSLLLVNLVSIIISCTRYLGRERSYHRRHP